MTTRTVRDVRVGARSSSTFDPRGWSLSERRVAAVACCLAYAVSLACVRGADLRILAILLVVDVLSALLPWRIPRTARSGPSFWFETLVSLISPLGAVAVAVSTDPAWLRAAGSPWWYLCGALCGVLLIAVSGVDPRGLLSGELAFILGPTPRAHGTARAFASGLGPLGEEALYRVPGVLVAPSTPLGLLAAVAFVARHHAVPGTNGRLTRRSTLVEILAAVLLLGLTALSRSVYPALLAHLLNNIPAIVRELQREPAERGSR